MPRNFVKYISKMLQRSLMPQVCTQLTRGGGFGERVVVPRAAPRTVLSAVHVHYDETFSFAIPWGGEKGL